MLGKTRVTLQALFRVEEFSFGILLSFSRVCILWSDL